MRFGDTHRVCGYGDFQVVQRPVLVVAAGAGVGTDTDVPVRKSVLAKSPWCRIPHSGLTPRMARLAFSPHSLPISTRIRNVNESRLEVEMNESTGPLEMRVPGAQHLTCTAQKTAGLLLGDKIDVEVGAVEVVTASRPVGP